MKVKFARELSLQSNEDNDDNEYDDDDDKGYNDGDDKEYNDDDDNDSIENKDDDYDAAGPPPHQSVSRLSPSGGAGKNTINEQESQQAENQGTSQENFQEYYQNILCM